MTAWSSYHWLYKDFRVIFLKEANIEENKKLYSIIWPAEATKSGCKKAKKDQKET